MLDNVDFFLTGFSLYMAEQPLQVNKSQEKDQRNEGKHRGPKLFRLIYFLSLAIVKNMKHFKS